VAALSAIWVAGTYGGIEFWVPLKPGETWALEELGATASLVPEYRGMLLLPQWAGWITTGIGLALASVLLANFPFRRFTEREKFIVWVMAGQFALTAVLWLFYDRYNLVYLPLAIVLVLARQPSIRLRPAWAGVVLYGAVSMIGTRDHLAYNAAVWSGVAELQAQGVPAAELNGGYVVNGWLQYVRPEQAHRSPEGRIEIPWVNEQLELPYTVANWPRRDAEVLKTIPYSCWLRPSGAVYVLKRRSLEGLAHPAGPQRPTPPKVDRRTIPEANEVSLPLLVAAQLHNPVSFSQLLPTGMLCGWCQAIMTYSRVNPVPRCRHMVRQCVKTHLTQKLPRHLIRPLWCLPAGLRACRRQSMPQSLRSQADRKFKRRFRTALPAARLRRRLSLACGKVCGPSAQRQRAAAARCKVQRGLAQPGHATEARCGVSLQGAPGRGPWNGRWWKAGEGGLHTGFQRLKGVKYPAAARTLPTRPRVMSWA
jgi:hypothetical protein